MGGGYLGALGRGYGLVSPELGLEGGRGLRWGVGALYAPRVLGASIGVRHGGGLAGQVLFRLARTGGEDGGLLLGARASAEAVEGVPTGLFPVRPGRALGHLRHDREVVDPLSPERTRP